jgi:hypothetical protein
MCRAAGHERYVDEGVVFTGEKFVPRDVDWDHPVYATSFESDEVLAGWQLEGGRSVRIEGGDLVLDNGVVDGQGDDKARHLVCWLKREVPADFLLEFTVQPKHRDQGLNIIFFNARGVGGQSIFSDELQKRDGTFNQYHSGEIDNYHTSYWAAGRDTANLRKNKGFHLVSVGKDLVAEAPDGTMQTVRLYKRGGHIRLMVDDVVAVSFDDDGKRYGPVHEHAGWVGLRQMAHTESCRYGELKVYPLK